MVTRSVDSSFPLLLRCDDDDDRADGDGGGDDAEGVRVVVKCILSVYLVVLVCVVLCDKRLCFLCSRFEINLFLNQN